MIYFHTDNNMQKILPVGESPLKGYPYYGAFFGIVDAYTKNYLEWIYNYFMQLYVANNHDIGMRVDFSTPKIEKSLPWIEVEKIERLFLHNIFGSCVNFYKNAIDYNKYIFTLLDNYYDSNSSAYGKNHFVHEHFLYGYDDENKLFYFADNYQAGKYAHGTIPYIDVENGNTSIIENHLVDWHKGPFLLSYNTQYDYCMAEYHNSHEHVFNKEILYDLIEDFLQKRNSEKRWVPAGTLSGKAIRYEKCWGLDVYAFLKNHIMLAGEATEKCPSSWLIHLRM